MKTWRKIRLGDACKTNMYSYSPKENWNFVNYLDTGNITDNKIDSIQYIDIVNEKLPSRARRKVKKDSIIYSTVRPNQHHFGIIKSQPENFLVSTGFAVIDTDSKVLDADFLYYLLTQSTVVESLHAIAEQSTSAYPSIKPSDIENLEIEIPDIATQKKIADVLFSLDKKIAQNMEINKNLEEQAATLFSENYFNRNYNVSKLEDIATIKYGKGLPTKKLTPKGFPVFGGNGVIGKYIHFMYDEPQILVSCRGAASGNIIETYPNSFVTNNSLVLEWNDYRYYEFYKQFLFANPLHTYATGSAQPQITIDNIKNVPFPCPKYDEIRELCSQLKSISALHFENIVESNKLSMLRDTLLPKLISGELDVSNLDI